MKLFIVLYESNDGTTTVVGIFSSCVRAVSAIVKLVNQGFIFANLSFKECELDRLCEGTGDIEGIHILEKPCKKSK
jgi:hypothetical protein